MNNKDQNLSFFQSNLVALRKEKGLTQAEAAKRINISYSMLAMMEAGYRCGSFHTLRKVSSFYGVTVDELFEKNFFEPNSHEMRPA